jgi:hypothetical protein
MVERKTKQVSQYYWLVQSFHLEENADGFELTVAVADLQSA